MVFIIAECGVNWRDLVDADDMIREAARAGADAVKWQCYKPFYEPGSTCGPAHPRAKELNAIRLDESTIRYLYWRCQQHGVEFMATPMYEGAVPLLNPFVERWKVRHADRNNTDLRKYLQRTGKPVLLSRDHHGGTLEGEIQLYCDPSYPPAGSPNLALEGFDGYSCHIPFWDEIRTDLVSHLKYLEVHVRLDRYEPHYCPIDCAVSITMSELAELCRRLEK